MTDEKYVFEQTSRERKRNARGSFAKKGGSRSKRCSLPSDYLTAKQRKELNGVVETINTMKILEWEDFKKLSKSMQEQYLEGLFTIHNARVIDIANMFHIAEMTFRTYAHRHEIDLPTMAKKSAAYKKRCPTNSWRTFLKDSRAINGVEVPEHVEDKNVTPVASDAVKLDDPDDASVNEASKLLQIVSGSLNYIGDPAAVFQKVMLALDPSKRYHIQVRYQVYEEKEVLNDD